VLFYWWDLKEAELGPAFEELAILLCSDLSQGSGKNIL
jgi:hypothetical protein